MDIQLGQPLKENKIKSLDEIEIQGKKMANSSIRVLRT